MVPTIRTSVSSHYLLAEAYEGLRARALATKADAIATTELVFGVVMETGYSEAVVTLVALADGTASLYFSNGGGVIGAGQHPRPSVAARSLVAFASHNLSHLAKVTQTPLAEPGRTRFYVLTANGTFAAEAPENDLGENRHGLSPLFHSAHELIAEIRRVDEQSRDA